jgi:hypothetical protein
VFLLDILSHRMSDNAMFRQPSFCATTIFPTFIDLPVSQT